MLPESSGEEQAELSLSIYVPIFIVILCMLEVRYMENLF